MVTSAGAPLPVQQRAWDTRERILRAAVECLAEDGYQATTTSRIQQRAGVSRGSLLHQFPVRDDLLVAAMKHLAAERMVAIATFGESSSGSLDEAVDALWDTYHGPLFIASRELWFGAAHNPDLAAALAPHEHALMKVIREQVLPALFGARRAAHPAFGDLTALLISSMRGVALTYAFEPRDHRRDPNRALWRGLAHSALGE
ncbi:TetR/AcrR family transcriptional regulator [Umezawaea endophytica]|uniref:TetR/AcrR family transcriptional regulator n=1 Tax=Umezawaea endophytica TaxID=1654476 RepID=A0A9X3ADL3_9PSEU|nr:TetR/AcrR family transcriptional regulator [Umezawaea endophytica]MCS7475816.1 TetR/AcrR family transcriptional regulator [Umezawaea endophytica]